MAFRRRPPLLSFVPRLESLATGAVDAARQLQTLFESIPIADATVVSIVAAERRADDLTRDLLAEVDRALPAGSREDIYLLTDKLDDVFDAIRAAAELAQQHHLSKRIEGLSSLTELLVRITEANVRVFENLRTGSDITADVAMVDRLETEGDDIHRFLVGILYSGAYEALEVLRWTNVIERIEKAINAVEKTSRLARGLAMKRP
jgi:uncharacterized protein Yka (UPF0111/DUF47 family)